MMLSHGYPPTLSGVTLVVQKLSRALVRQGHEVLVVTASECGGAYLGEDEGVQLERLRSLRNPFWSEGPVPLVSTHKLEQLIRSFRPDVIHTHENALLSFQVLRVQRQPGMPLISSSYYLPRYVTQYLRWGSLLGKAIESGLWKYSVFNLNQFDFVVFSTRTQQQQFIEHGLSASSAAISNGVNISRYFPHNSHKEDIEKDYDLPPRPRILFVGRLMKDKKIDVLIQAMEYVCAKSEAHLLIVGRGDEREKLAAQARALGLERYVYLLGYVPEKDLPALYRGADLFAIASVCEVQSIPALQAVATGLPIVAVEAAALPELVRAGYNGLLVPPNDPQALAQALLQVVRDPTYCAALGQASLEMINGHSEQKTFERYAELYQDLVAKSHMRTSDNEKVTAL